MMIEVPCKFCGEKAEVDVEDGSDFVGWTYFVCWHCCELLAIWIDTRVMEEAQP